VALQALEDTGVALGIGLASLVNALNPEIVVFGGILSVAGDILLPVMEDEIRKRALPWSAKTMKLVRAAHGSNACVMGGVATVYHEVLSRPFGTATIERRNAYSGNTGTSIEKRIPTFQASGAIPGGGEAGE